MATAQQNQNKEVDIYLENSNSTRMAKLLHRIAAGNLSKFENNRDFIFPFYIDERYIKSLEQEIIEHIEKFSIQNVRIDFDAWVRFADSSSMRFDNMERFLNKAGNSTDPESIKLEWGKFSILDNGEPISSEVIIEFVTEQKLKYQSTSPENVPFAYVKISVRSSDPEWSEHTYIKLAPYMVNSKLGGIYRPLWIFRNQWVTTIVSHTTGWVGFFTGAHVASNYICRNCKLEKVNILNSILSAGDARSKLDELAKYWFTPIESYWWDPILIMASGAIFYVIVSLSLSAVLPRLTPRSVIAIGLSSRRADDYMNIFKFFVFTALISGIIIPTMRELLKALM